MTVWIAFALVAQDKPSPRDVSQDKPLAWLTDIGQAFREAQKLDRPLVIFAGVES